MVHDLLHEYLSHAAGRLHCVRLERRAEFQDSKTVSSRSLLPVGRSHKVQWSSGSWRLISARVLDATAEAGIGRACVACPLLRRLPLVN